MRAVLVVELDLPDDAPHHALPDAAAALGRPPHSVGCMPPFVRTQTACSPFFEKETP